MVMDRRETTPFCASFSSIADEKGVCIFFVKVDIPGGLIIDEMLRHPSQEVLDFGDVFHVLKSIEAAKDRIECVVTNAHHMVMQYSEKRLPESNELCLDSSMSSIAVVLYGLSQNDLVHLRKYGLNKLKERTQGFASREEAIHRDFVAHGKYMKPLSSSQDILKHRKNSKKLNKHHLQKKRVEWTADLHSRFVKACNQLGREQAVPKRILEIMDIPGLTREQVASHLQKYRNSLKSFGSDQLSISSSNKMEEAEAQCASHNGTRFCLTDSQILPSPSSLRHLYSHEGFSLGSTWNLGFCEGLITPHCMVSVPEQMHNFSCSDKMISELPLSVEDFNFSSNDCKQHSGNFAGYVLTNNQISVEIIKLEASSSRNVCIPATSQPFSPSTCFLFESVFQGEVEVHDGRNKLTQPVMMASCSLAQDQSSSMSSCLQEKTGVELLDDDLMLLFDPIDDHVYPPSLLSPENQYFDYLLGQHDIAGS